MSSSREGTEKDKQENNYVLRVGEKGKPRLKLLNDMCNPATLEFIEKNIDLKNKNILDLGCGIGILSCELAKRSLPNGSVTAVDISQEQLDLTKSHAEKNNITNITCRQLSANEIDKLNIKFDLIYCRFLLAHLQTSREVILKVTTLMHENSIFICEEPNSVDSLYCEPSEPIFEKFKRAVFKQVEVSKADFSIGRSLYSIFAQHNLVTVEMRNTQATLNTSDLKQQLWQGIIEISALLIESGFASENEIKEMVESLKNFSNTSTSKVGYLECTQIATKRK
jgi:2-polyprenyl-3-methyl-5-hydroxy-6-metoxy-1,4-benzoquinol methylase